MSRASSKHPSAPYFFGVNEVIDATPTQLQEGTRDVRDRYAVIAYLMSSDRNRYSKILEDLTNQNAQGFEDFYPKNLVDAYRLLTHYHTDPKNLACLLDGTHFDGLLFFTNNKPNRDRPARGGLGGGRSGGRGGREIITGRGRRGGRGPTDMVCYKCGIPGHNSNEGKCPPDNTAETNLTMDTNDTDNREEFNFTTLALRHNKLKNSWILLDNQSTVDFFSNASLLTNIRKVQHPKVIRSHRGTKITDIKGDLPGHPNLFYYDEEGAVNILSLSKVKETFRVTYDSENGKKSLCIPLMEISNSRSAPNACSTMTQMTAMQLYLLQQ